MGIHLLRGRYFTQEDSSSTPLVALIDESMARRYWPNKDPLGKRFKGQDQRGKSDDWITVVGVVSDTHRSGLERSYVPHVYEPYTQAIDGDKTPDVIVRFAGDSSQVASALRNLARQLDSGAILSPVTSLDKQLSSQLSPRRFQTLLLTLFSLFALLLASLGIYGVLSYSVAQRTHEIGVRIALGARQGQVLRLVIGEGSKFALAGLAIGLVLAAGMTRFLASLLFGVSATDPATFLSVGLLLMTVELAACYIPARRASKVDPMVALRYE
jgi:putative ABC transport system permease protein